MVKAVLHGIVVLKKMGVNPWGLQLMGIQKTNLKKYKRLNRLLLRRKQKRREIYRKSRIRYVYRLDIVELREPRRRYNRRFTSLRIVKFFYLTLKYFHFRRMARNARKKDGFFEGHYCLALEGRLLNFVYRTGFAADMFEAWAFVRQGFITLDRKTHTFSQTKVNLYEFLALHVRIKKMVYFSLLVRLCINKRSLLSHPRYMYVSY